MPWNGVNCVAPVVRTLYAGTKCTVFVCSMLKIRAISWLGYIYIIFPSNTACVAILSLPIEMGGDPDLNGVMLVKKTS